MSRNTTTILQLRSKRQGRRPSSVIRHNERKGKGQRSTIRPPKRHANRLFQYRNKVNMSQQLPKERVATLNKRPRSTLHNICAHLRRPSCFHRDKARKGNFEAIMRRSTTRTKDKATTNAKRSKEQYDKQVQKALRNTQ